MVAAVALVLGLIGLIRLEPRAGVASSARSESYTVKEMASVITADPVARTYFLYLLLLLAAILGQDVLLEALEDFPGGMLFVSHDRHFVDRLATGTLSLGLT